MTEPEVTTRVVVQEWFAECWMQRVLADDLPAAKAAIARRLEEFPERVYRAVEEQTSVTRRVVVDANTPGKPRPKSRKKDEDADTSDAEPGDADTTGEDAAEDGQVPGL